VPCDKVWPLIEVGTVLPVIHRTFPLAEAAEAHRLMESSPHIGKICLCLTDRSLAFATFSLHPITHKSA
jgi:Zinc-binding dehydrogenase